MTTKVLVSGFGPYGGMSVNPTELLVAEAQGFDLEGIEVRPVLLPVDYDGCARRLVEEVGRLSPDVVVSCGLYPGRTAVTPERVGVNAKDTAAEDPIGDNNGRRPVDEPVDPAGPDALFSLLPYRRIVDSLKAAGIPAFVSNSAGTFICNNTFYGLMNHVKTHDLPVAAGFVHFPASTEMAVERPTMPSLPMPVMVEALRMIVRIAAEERQAKIPARRTVGPA